MALNPAFLLTRKLLEDVLQLMWEDAQQDVFGPWIIHLSPLWQSRLEQPYVLGSGRASGLTLRQRLLDCWGIVGEERPIKGVEIDPLLDGPDPVLSLMELPK